MHCVVIDERKTFKGGSWVDIAFLAFVAVCGIGFLAYSQVRFVMLGVPLLLAGVLGIFGSLSARLEISDADVTTRMYFHWSRVYRRADLHQATVDWRFFGFPRSVPVMVLKSGREIRLWSLSKPTLFRFRTSKRTAEIVSAINHSLGFRVDSTQSTGSTVTDSSKKP
jgi:hypothetical protein